MFEPSVVRGLEYYTGAVFEAELLLSTLDEKGQPMRFGSIGGGGRYDDLVARFTGERTPATGFSFGVSRLASALKAAGRDLAQARARAGGGDRLRPGADGRLFRRGRANCAPPASPPRSISDRRACGRR